MYKFKNSAKKILSGALAVSMPLSLAACNKGGGNGGDTENFTWFISDTDATSFGYIEYSDSPAMQYLLSKDWADCKLSIDFDSPPAGQGTDTFQRMISTQSETDIMTITYSTDGIMSLYEQGIIMDVTDEVTKYMPNYINMLNENGLYNRATYELPGKEGRRFLGIGRANEIDYTSLFCGWEYRRDWIIKYGTPDPNSGIDKFEGHCETEGDYDTWTDNVKFPSWFNSELKAKGTELDPAWDGSDPMFISDWEWMFEIFDKAIKDQNIDGGYVLSMYYPGYNENGDLVSSFGGGNPAWYMDKNGQCQFGAITDNFKAYVECMSSWWDKVWLDKGFSARSRDMFYQIDDPAVRQGKIGFWMGMPSALGNRIEQDSLPLTEGAVVFGARNPVNDVYGGDEQKFKAPDTFFGGTGWNGTGVCISTKAQNKNLEALFTFFDYFYSEEGSILNTMGLSKEQLNEETTPQSVRDWYKQYGMEDGAYTTETDENGKTVYRLNPACDTDNDMWIASQPYRIEIGYQNLPLVTHNFGDTLVHSRKEWQQWENTGFIDGFYRGQMTAQENKTYSSTRNTILLEYMQVEIPKFIKGTRKMDTWDAFVDQLKARGCEDVNAIFNRIFDANK